MDAKAQDEAKKKKKKITIKSGRGYKLKSYYFDAAQVFTIEVLQVPSRVVLTRLQKICS